MITSPRKLFAILGIALGATLTLAGPARAGTPLLCVPNDIGAAPSLPWGPDAGGKQPRADYDPSRLIADTLALLTPRTPVLERMETMRRATLYATRFAKTGRPELGAELLARLQARVLDAEAAGPPAGDALAWFDAGYFAGSIEAWSATRARHQYAGYAWVVKASRARGIDPAMELAAAIMSFEDPRKSDGHWARASAGSKSNPLLARNLASRRAQW
jgi:hypothetical protein